MQKVLQEYGLPVLLWERPISLVASLTQNDRLTVILDIYDDNILHSDRMWQGVSASSIERQH